MFVEGILYHVVRASLREWVPLYHFVSLLSLKSHLCILEKRILKKYREPTILENSVLGLIESVNEN